MRHNQRRPDEIRPIRFTPHFISRTPGSVLVELGETRVVCTATYENRVQHFLRGKGSGWITAEYAMLPGSTGNQRVARERLKINHRHGEIQRFMGRALRSTLDLKKLGERTITIDADVISADGSTRCASVCGGMMALLLLLKHMVYETVIPHFPAPRLLASVSVGVCRGEVVADLDYEEDSSAESDIAVVSNEAGELIEVMAFAEGKPLSVVHLSEAVAMAEQRNREIIGIIRTTLGEAGLAL